LDLPAEAEWLADEERAPDVLRLADDEWFEEPEREVELEDERLADVEFDVDFEMETLFEMETERLAEAAAPACAAA